MKPNKKIRARLDRLGLRTRKLTTSSWPVDQQLAHLFGCLETKN